MKATWTQFTTHPEGESPVYAEGAVRVTLDDEGAGAFFVLEQDGASIRVDPDELELIATKAREMLAQAGGE